MKEEELSFLVSIVESSCDAIIGKDLNNSITSWNKGAETLYGYSREEAIGQDVNLIIPEDKLSEVQALSDSVMKGERINQFETIRKKKNGELIAVSISLAPIYDADGKLIGVSNTTRDISAINQLRSSLQKSQELKERELKDKYEELSAVYEELTATEEELRANYNELERSKEEVEKANAAKDQFLANMSHEIRTPLNGIIGLSDLLSYTELSEEQHTYVNMIKDSSKSLLDIVNELLEISKIQSNTFDLESKPFNFKESIDRIIKDYSIICGKKGLDFYYYIDPLIPQELVGDELKLNQILINILSNAVKFTESGHVILRVKKMQQNSEKITMHFTITDTGIGIKSESKNDIFNKFVQQKNSYNKSYPGIGLGLSIAKELVKRMNGEIWVESEEGKGSSFNFTLELLITPCQQEPAIAKADSADNRLSEKKIILVVEDNYINMRIVTEMIKKLGYDSINASNGKEALEVLKKLTPNLVLMDIQMPELNGYDTTKIIRKGEAKDGGHIPIVAMTAYAMINDRELFIGCGMDDYMSKPFNINKLSEVINNNIK